MYLRLFIALSLFAGVAATAVNPSPNNFCKQKDEDGDKCKPGSDEADDYQCFTTLTVCHTEAKPCPNQAQCGSTRRLDHLDRDLKGKGKGSKSPKGTKAPKGSSVGRDTPCCGCSCITESF